MAVTQISRIQLRRGRKGATDLPQLASGEMGWAIDSQELYIGNGAVAEGAPYVGNTKILTEHDNILDMALQYQYQRNSSAIQTGESTAQPTMRSLQERLDDTTSVNNFGVKGNGQDDTVTLQRVFDQLYLNDATKGTPAGRIEVTMPAGEFLISQSLRIPPFTNIKGAGKDKTIITQTQDFPVFITVGDDSTPGNYTDYTTMTSLNQPRNITIIGITFKQTRSTSNVATLHAMRDSRFEDVKFVSTWQLGQTIQSNIAGLELTAKSALVTCQNNKFINCEFGNVSNAVLSSYDIDSNEFSNCTFSNIGAGVMFGLTTDGSAGKQIGPTNNQIVNSKFVNVSNHGVRVFRGHGNASRGNKFVSVGNQGGSSETALYPVFSCHDAGNYSDNDYFERANDLSVGTSTTAYIGVFSGPIIGNHKINQVCAVSENSAENVPLFRLGSRPNYTYRVHYTYRSLQAGLVRNGILNIASGTSGNTVSLDDEYTIAGTSANADNLQFSAKLLDLNSDTVFETLNINYTNTTANDQGTLSYWYEVIG